LDRGADLPLRALASFFDHLLELVEDDENGLPALGGEALDAVEDIGEHRERRLRSALGAGEGDRELVGGDVVSELGAEARDDLLDPRAGGGGGTGERARGGGEEGLRKEGEALVRLGVAAEDGDAPAREPALEGGEDGGLAESAGADEEALAAIDG